MYPKDVFLGVCPLSSMAEFNRDCRFPEADQYHFNHSVLIRSSQWPLTQFHWVPIAPLAFDDRAEVNGVHICAMRDEESRNVLVFCLMPWCFPIIVNGVHICSMRDEQSHNLTFISAMVALEARQSFALAISLFRAPVAVLLAPCNA
jgi:hypothetical protein